MHLLLAAVLTFFIYPTIFSFSIYNDLLPMYENSQETNDSEERLLLFKEKIQDLASFLLKNVSQICPLDQPDYFRRIEKIVTSTLAEIYENEEMLSKNIFYEYIIPPVKTTLEKCVGSTKSRISLEEYNKREYSETILHVDLKSSSDITKWFQFRPCIRTQMKSNFYPGTVPSAIDTLWQSFLLGYMGCSEHWGSIKEWNFLDLVQQIIIRPLFQRWGTKFPRKVTETSTDKSNGTMSSEIIEVLSQSTSGHANESQLSLDSISAWLEKCNVILFLRHKIDPVPCFRDVIYSRG